jgi:hypothetical protein
MLIANRFNIRIHSSKCIELLWRSIFVLGNGNHINDQIERAQANGFACVEHHRFCVSVIQGNAITPSQIECATAS